MIIQHLKLGESFTGNPYAGDIVIYNREKISLVYNGKFWETTSYEVSLQTEALWNQTEYHAPKSSLTGGSILFTTGNGGGILQQEPVPADNFEYPSV